VTTLLLVAVPLLLAALLAAGATSVRSVSRIWLRHWAEQCLRGSEAASLYLERPQRLLLAASAGTTACAGLAGGLLLVGGARGAVLAAWIAGVAISLVVFGQLLPHAVARRWPARLVPALLPLLSAVAWLATPAFAAGGRLSRRFRSTEPQTEEAAVRDELEELLRDSELEGIGERTENAIIAGVVRFGETRVHDVMTPRTEIVAVDEGTPRGELARVVAASGYSRVPLFRGTIDDITGVVHVFDLLDAERRAPDAVRPVAFTGPAEPCSDLLVRMLERRQHLAIVRGDTGAVLGLVSLEDLLEALVGDIRDEHDDRADGSDAIAPRGA
jgi:putative hemolysin